MPDNAPQDHAPAAKLPFQITICGIEELSCHAEGKVSHVLSILDPDHVEPEAFGAYGEHAKLELRFKDEIEDFPGADAPQLQHVEQVLTFGRDILRDPEALRHLLVHCHMGISRSTAAMTLLLAEAQPATSARDVLHQVLGIRERAWPNLRMLTLGEELLGRPGQFSSAVGEIYRYQLDRRPQLRNFFMDIGRAREVVLAENWT
ncbi:MULTISPECIES: protein-tyrosine-phosphatase [Rhodomicrobium]|uniref:tyrosine phosphatase family protein n=1 Tax=Rhodomicrobium TaxID=1068 RepID=UPI000B4A5E8E|nr:MULTISPECIES: protein-tyrosine-phosphatase [Rhodomicrobium]